MGGWRVCEWFLVVVVVVVLYHALGCQRPSTDTTARRSQQLASGAMSDERDMEHEKREIETESMTEKRETERLRKIEFRTSNCFRSKPHTTPKHRNKKQARDLCGGGGLKRAQPQPHPAD